ncbi:MAG TPA: Uma2 family endonuclease [Dehalococcoidia bacterium]|nr:Uma2 family endonuclease [Dehalococcoidia bacterium]HIN72794.1 Uma2 family endonuclease [Dehalococcoidia bacterium]
MGPLGNRHASCVDRLVDLLTLLTRQQAITRVQNPVHINDYSTVEPDLMLLVRRDDFYVSDRPSSSDVLLLVEVSDTTLQYDRNVKFPIYANAGIVEVWIADLQSMQLKIFSQPSSDYLTT